MRERLASWYPDELTGRWWQAVLWVPVGYATTRLFGTTLPLGVIAGLAAAAAVVHWTVPVAVDLAAGAGALGVGVSQATGDGCHLRLGDAGTAVLLVFGGLMIGVAGVRLMGPVKVKESGRRLLVGAVGLELSLALTRPANEIAPAEGAAGTALALGVLLVAIVLVGIWAPFGPALLGVALLATEALIAVTDGSCQSAATRAVVGTLVFVPVAVLLASRWRPPYRRDDEHDEDHDHSSERWTGEHDHPESDRWTGDYDDYGPLPDRS